MLATLACFIAVPMQTYITRDARFQIDAQGTIASIESRRTGKEYCPPGHPSPLLSLEVDGKLVGPSSATFRKGGEIELAYPNGSFATVKAAVAGRYCRFTLTALSERSKVDCVVWGPLHTTISKMIGDLIGVVRDGDWAIGILGLDDNTITGVPTDGDFAPMGYYVHSPDPAKIPVPPPFREGQRFNIGGDGVSDVAFYSHPEEYFQMVFGNGAVLEPSFGSTLAYHSRDRQKPKTHLLSLLPGFAGSRPRHQVTDAVDNVDYIGSSVALYACPDRDGLNVIRQIIQTEKLPFVQNNGSWVRDPAGLRTDAAWWGPHDRMIEYVDALGIKAVQDEGQGEYYANPADHWQGPRVAFKDGRSLSYKEYLAEVNQHGIAYGLHSLCLFLQPNRCTDVSPEASPHLQTVLRTTLDRDLKPGDTDIVVTDPSYLAEDGTWPMRNGSNTLRIGTELIHYEGISSSAPWTMKGVKRGFAGTRATAHRAGDEVAKLQMNCYDGFAPDMQGMLEYADYYAAVMVENGMRYIDYDGLESTLYQGHGYFGVRRFLRRFFGTYAKLTGGKQPRVMGSAVFAGGWEFMGNCNIGGGTNMFDPVLNRWGIEGKDVRNGFANSYFAPTFGIQNYGSDWSVYDAENLQAKAIGWDATYMLGLTEEAVERSGEKDAIFRAFRTWEDARVAGAFPAAVKERLKDLGAKFHLERSGSGFQLTPVKEIRNEGAGSQDLSIDNPFASQPLECAIRFLDPVGAVDVVLPGGLTIHSSSSLEAGCFLIVKSDRAYVSDRFRKIVLPLSMSRPAQLPSGRSEVRVALPGQPGRIRYEVTAWAKGKPTTLRSSRSR
jgi:hypothetical protein